MATTDHHKVPSPAPNHTRASGPTTSSPYPMRPLSTSSLDAATSSLLLLSSAATTDHDQDSPEPMTEVLVKSEDFSPGTILTPQSHLSDPKWHPQAGNPSQRMVEDPVHSPPPSSDPHHSHHLHPTHSPQQPQHHPQPQQPNSHQRTQSHQSVPMEDTLDREADATMKDVTSIVTAPATVPRKKTISTAASKKRRATPSSPSTVPGDSSRASSMTGGVSMTPSPRLGPHHPESGSSPARKNSVSSSKKDHHRMGVTATSCANCGTTTTPLWRRATNGQTICNACGLYFKARNLTRPVWLKRNMGLKKGGSAASELDGSDEVHSGPAGEGSNTGGAKTGDTGDMDESTNDSECAGSCPGDGNCNGTGGAYSCAGCPSFNQHQTNRQHLVCANCRTTTTPLWRRDSGGNTICNACGLYFKLHNVHRPVTMKRAVIKRRKRVNLLATSPPLALEDGQEQPSQISQPPVPPQPKPARPPKKSAQPKVAPEKAAPEPQASVPASDVEANTTAQEDKQGKTPTKRRKMQAPGNSRGVPAIEDFILPQRAANGQTEWIRRDPGPPKVRRSMSPIENIGNGQYDRRHHHHHHHTHTMPSQSPSHSSPSSSGHEHSDGPVRQQAPYGAYSSHSTHLPQPTGASPRHSHTGHQGSGQYSSPPLSAMSTSSRSPMHYLPVPRSQQQQTGSMAVHSHPLDYQGQHHRHSSLQHGMDYSSEPRPSSMEDSMQPSSPYSSQSSGWNQRLPGYATVSSSAFSTRLTSTGVVHSSGAGSPPLYPRHLSTSPNAPYPQLRSGRSPSRQGHAYQDVESPPLLPQPLPKTSLPPSGSGYSSAYHHPLSSILNPVHETEDSDMGRKEAHLPPISLPHLHGPGPRGQGHHRLHSPLPRPADILHSEHALPSPSQMHPYSQQARRTSSTAPSSGEDAAKGVLPPALGPGSASSATPPTAPAATATATAAAAASVVAKGTVADNEVLQQTRQDLQREVTHLSMLLGRAAAVLNGLDQALGTTHTTTPETASSTAVSAAGSSPPAVSATVPAVTTVSPTRPQATPYPLPRRLD